METFLFDKISSPISAQIIFQGNATIFDPTTIVCS